MLLFKNAVCPIDFPFAKLNDLNPATEIPRTK